MRLYAVYGVEHDILMAYKLALVIAIGHYIKTGIICVIGGIIAMLIGYEVTIRLFKEIICF